MDRFRFLAIIWILAAGCASHPVVPAAIDVSRYHGIAVIPFQTEGFLERYGSEAADHVMVEILQRDPSFPLVEREAIDHVLREHELRTDRTGSASVADLLPADLIVTGTVHFLFETTQSPSLAREAWLTATVRAFETGSGRVVWAERFRGTSFDLIPDGGAFRFDTDSELREAAFRELARVIVDRLLGNPSAH